jgi:diguanylate cyclase (GGDEF)-like protein/PAS domain S-box-containing protein
VAATAFETNEGIVITDARNIIQQVNRTFVRITGYPDDEVVGRHTRVLKSGRHERGFYEAMWKAIAANGSWAGEVWNRRRGGQEYPAWLTITAVRGEGGEVTHYVATLVDITQRKAAEEKIARLAFFDPLTRLPNRRLMMDRIQHALAARARSGDCGALLFIDLDHFKLINDTHGHDRGDRLLQQVARRLAAAVRACDTVARFGGDEFVVLLEDLSADRREAELKAVAVAEQIIGRLNAVFDLDGLMHRTTPSIGVTVFDSGPTSVMDLLKQADVAMYQAKGAGRNAVRVYDPSVNIPASLLPLDDDYGETAW